MTRIITMNISHSTTVGKAQVSMRSVNLGSPGYEYQIFNCHFQVNENAYNIQTAGEEPQIPTRRTSSTDKPEIGSDITMRFSWILRRIPSNAEVGRGTSTTFYSNWKAENQIGGITATWRGPSTNDIIKDIEELNHDSPSDESDRRVTVPVWWGSLTLPRDWARVTIPNSFATPTVPQSFAQRPVEQAFASVAPPHRFTTVQVDQQFGVVSISDEFAGVSVPQEFARVHSPVNFALVPVPQVFARVPVSRPPHIIPYAFLDQYLPVPVPHYPERLAEAPQPPLTAGEVLGL